MIVKTVVFLIAAGFGVMMLYVGLTQWFMQRKLVANPQRVKAVIIQSEVIESRSSDTDNRPLRDNSTISYRPEVKFRYTIDGRTYESDLLRPTIIITAGVSRDSVLEELKPYPVGATVEAFVNPQMPDKAFLRNDPSIGPVVFMIVGLVVPVVGFLAAKFVV
ncbi:MAG: DUF3592 domain-containing protein [Tepidisphaeraceae bacterium]